MHFSQAQSNATSSGIEHRAVARHRVLGISLRMVTWLLSFLVFWNLLLLALGITIGAAQGRRQWEGTAAGVDSYEYDDAAHALGEREKAGVVFLWCTFPFVALMLSIFDLVCRNRLTVRRAVFAAGFGSMVYIFAFVLWRDCAYSSSYNGALYPVCQHDPDAQWSDKDWRNPLAIIWVLPWFALASAILYTALTVLALVALRRQRSQCSIKENPVEHRKSVSLVEIGEPSKVYAEMGTPSKEYVEMGTRSISEMMDPGAIGDDTLTLPSRAMSTAPSRQPSLADRSKSPPDYQECAGDASLLAGNGKDEKRGSVE